MPAGAGEMVIEDFKAATASDWRVFSDQVMGGVSTGSARIVDGALHLTGSVSTANNGGFLQARLDLRDRLDAETTALKIRVRGDGQRYFIHLRTTGTRLPWQYYQAGFDTTGDWQDVTLDLAAFKASGRLMRDTPRAESIKSVALVAFGRDHEADVWLDSIEAIAP